MKFSKAIQESLALEGAPAEYTKLPDRLSDLLEVAVEDARALEGDPRYELAMQHWHLPNIYNKCLVCMAGSVMVKRLAAPFDRIVGPSYYDEEEIKGKLRAINRMRIADCPTYEARDVEVFAEAVAASDFDFDKVLGRASWDGYLRLAKALRAREDRGELVVDWSKPL